MAVTNFRASDFSKGKKIKEGKSPEREDSKILGTEMKNTVRNNKEGAKDARDLTAKVEEADTALNEEISRTETPLDEQEAPKAEEPKKATRKTAAKK